jgi:ABC-type Na+ efflux pump permease subunit
VAGALSVARQELARYTRLADRRVLVGTLLLAVLVGAAWPVAQDRGVTPDAGLYTVDANPGSPLAPVVDGDPALRHVGPGGDADVVVSGTEVAYDPSDDKSTAAAERLGTAARAYLDEALRGEEDHAAAFPVRVDLSFEARDLTTVTDGGAPADGDQSDDEQNGSDDDGDTGEETPASPPPGPPGESGGTADQAGPGTPADITPPFPMKSLLYTFAYLIPLTFVGELFGGSVFAERVKGRGRVLLAAPVDRIQLILGKSLPYAGATVLLAAGITVALGAGWTGFLAALPILAFALATALLIGTLAPSQRALTFLLVSANVLLSTFLFLPALFTEVPPIAFLSPVGLIAASIRGDPVGLVELAYGTLPLIAVTVGLGSLALGVVREETLFAPGGATAKLVDGLEHLVRTRPRLVLAGALAVPLALALELFVLVFAVTLSLGAAFVVFLVGSAFVEEALKALPAYATRARETPPEWATPVVGGLVGLGFFLGEKALAGLGLLGFGGLPRGSEALATFGVAGGPLLVLAPLVLHVIGPTLVAYAARRGRGWTGAAVLGGGLLHAAYNAIVVLAGQGGLP